MSKARRDLRRTTLASLLLAAVVFAVYSPVARNGFIVLDDEDYIYGNPQIRRGLTLETVGWALTTTEHANWYPLRRLSHLADVSIFGMWAGGHHLMSAAWHAAAAAVLFAALSLMTGAFWRSLAAAALFGVHPIQTESVAWAAERSNVLAGFFFGLALLLHARHARRPGAGRSAAALVAGALGLAAKPVLMTLPFLLLLLDVWPLGRMGAPGARTAKDAWPGVRRCLLEKIPLVALAAAAGSIAVVAHRQAGALSSLETLPLETRLGNAVLSYWRYLGKLFWPADLGAFYPHPGAGLHPGAACAAGLLLAGTTVLTLALRRRPWLAAGWLWYAGMLVPVSGIVQFGGHAMADRFAYLPCAGIFLALIWSVAEDAPAPVRRPAALAAWSGTALVALGAASVVQVRYWENDAKLFTHTLAVTSGNGLAEYSLGLALHRQGRREEAIARYLAAIGHQPFARAYYNLGNALAELGRHAEAVAAFQVAVRLAPGYAKAYNNLGNPLFALGRLEEAAAAYAEAVRLWPDDAVAHENLGKVLLLLRRPDEAQGHFREARRLRAPIPEEMRAGEPGKH